jgi:glycosyltransferase involved in cell wall biosynthesis
MNDKLSIIVPCYNEEKMIHLFYHEVKKHINELNISYEMIFVNDGSKDKTIDEVEKLHEIDKNVALISFSRNFGKESAMFAGLEYAKGEMVVIMDADLQHPPMLLKEMVRLINEEGYETVAAYRHGRRNSKGQKEPLLRTIYSKIFYRFINKMSDVTLKEGATDYRMMTRKVVDALKSLKEYNRFSKGLFEWVGFKTKYIPYQNVERVAGTSTWSFGNLFNYALEGITSFSVVPLRLASVLGLLCASISFIYMAYVIIFKMINPELGVEGWPTLVSITLFLGGIILISLGLLGEYIGRIYNEVKRRPIYIVENQLNSEIHGE